MPMRHGGKEEWGKNAQKKNVLVPCSGEKETKTKQLHPVPKPVSCRNIRQAGRQPQFIYRGSCLPLGELSPGPTTPAKQKTTPCLFWGRVGRLGCLSQEHVYT